MLNIICLYSLTSVAYIGPSREQRGPGTPKLAQIPTSHMTRTPLSGSKGQGHQAALLAAMLRRHAAAAVSAWERTAMFRSARRREALRRPLREKRGGAYCVPTRTACFTVDGTRRCYFRCRCDDLVASLQ